MKQFIDKLIERLEEEKKYCSYHPHTRDEAINKAISIVNQLAEEYSHRTEDLVIDDSLRTIDVLELLGESVNDGWISVEDKLPELTEGTECFKQSKCCLTTLRWWDGDMTESVGWYNQSGVWNEDSKNCKVVAWMPLPPKYQPKGQAHD